MRGCQDLSKVKRRNLNITGFFNGSNDLDLISELQAAYRRYHHVHLLNRLYQTPMVMEISLRHERHSHTNRNQQHKSYIKQTETGVRTYMEQSDA
jgi:hypothetical protein